MFDYKKQIKEAIASYNYDKAIELMAKYILITYNSRNLYSVDYRSYLLPCDYENLVKRAEELAYLRS